MRREAVGDTDQLVREHSDQRRPRGEMSMQVRHGVATQEIGQIAGLQQGPQDAGPTEAQGQEQRSSVNAGPAASDPHVGQQNRAEATPE